MTTTAVQPIEKFCSEKLIMCKYVNDLGSCRLTACARQLTSMTTNEAIDFLKKSKWTLAPHALEEAKWNEAVDMAVEALQANRPTGEWIMKSDGVIFKRTWGVCSYCGNTLDFDGLNAGRGNANYCPNCGAKMKGENHDQSTDN